LPRTDKAMFILSFMGGALPQLLKDSDKQVRLATLLALAEMPVESGIGEFLYDELPAAVENDRWLLDAAICVAARFDRQYLQAAASLARHVGQPRYALGVQIARSSRCGNLERIFGSRQ